MKVMLAPSAGFCLGVSLALKRLDKELKRLQAGLTTGRLITFGPIIHNPLVIQSYAQRGVLCESDPYAIREHDRVVIRAHGIPRDVEQRLQQSGAVLADATCPKVKKAQLAIARASAGGSRLLLFGEADHPEVQGLVSYARNGHDVFGNLEELAALRIDPAAPCFLAAQTTQERDIFHAAIQQVQQRLGVPPLALDTICDATRDRQAEVKTMSLTVQIMVVVGGLNSGNTRRLAEVARSCGVPAIHVEQVNDLTPEQLAQLAAPGVHTVGLTAGASTPDEHIAAVRDFLESRLFCPQGRLHEK